ncbi:FadR/GntR family transcriptional regulator [Acinetobacter populi]|uniref:HTH gntR-type domain-containing protein n=1 Tax=Acinetobacter populi TaxID=1582270 RepID=A0A1Z9YWC1_9GAMM|nr:FCD domain-containing protein [Acinetobacter populi]OUY06521.1 hypothetical protein CAP51_11350 [Acinetobacter populi]
MQYPIKKNSLVDETIRTIRQHIRQQTWTLNERIPSEAELVELFGIGRNTIREAIKILAYLGVLDVCQGDGTYVRAVDDFSESIVLLNRASLHDHLETRCLLEIEIARFAARRRNAEDIQNLQALLALREKINPLEDLEEFWIRDRDLHLAIAIASHNQALHATYRYFLSTSYEYTKLFIQDEDLAEPDHPAHETLVAAIISGDENQASAYARALLMPTIQQLEQLSTT